jgi:hypothetical protein
VLELLSAGLLIVVALLILFFAFAVVVKLYKRDSS